MIFRTLFGSGLLAALLTALAYPATAQSVTSASITGSVTDTFGRPLPRAVVTLEALSAGADQETVAGLDGAYRFSLVAPGIYQIRAEAIGYQPTIGRSLDLAGGDAIRLVIPVRVATPPVVSVDTIALESVATNRSRPGGLRLLGGDVDGIASRYGDLGDLAGLSTRFDGSLGSQGLPGSMSVVVADGVPFYRAQHPLRPDEHLADALFPRAFASGVSVLHDAPDVEWAGAAGGYATLGTRAGVEGSGVEAEASWSGGGLWSSSELGLDETPGLTSYQASGRTQIDLAGDTTRVLLAVEGLQHEAPLVPRASADLQAQLTGIDPELLVSLAAPSVERITRYSGLARFHTRPSETSRVFLRGTVAYSERSFDGLGPLPVGDWFGPGETSTDFSLAGSFVSEYRPGIALELRGGVSNSARDFETGVRGLASAYLVEAGLPLGEAPGAPAESSRTDAVFMPMARFQVGTAAGVKAGFLARATRFSMQSSPLGTGDFTFTDAAALVAGRGLARSASAAEADFSTREFGFFTQVDFSPAAGLDIGIGGRFDYELLPSGEPSLDTDWLAESGLRNDDYPDAFPQLGGRASVAWDPLNDGRTRLFGVGSLQFGDVDPARLFEVFANDGSGDVTTYRGTGASWPTGSFPGTAPALPTLSLFGPDTRPPRSVRASVGVVRELGGGLSVRVEGDFRRTDFLVRRRNLNLTVGAGAQDPHARDVWGSLVKDGALVTATDADARRFPEFAQVWALDPDGWSRYRGLTVGLEFRSRTLDLHGAFTRSETKDNWIGAASGSPDAQLSPLLPDFVGGWDEGRSDFDVPNRATAVAVLRVPSLPGTALSATYRYSSGRPFTPRYRRGVDANGDGSFQNDIPFVPQPAELGEILAAWPCLDNQAGGFAVRNSCRAPSRQTLDVGLEARIGRIAGQGAALFVEGLNLLDTKDGLVDDALLLVDPDMDLLVSGGGSRIEIPVNVNPDFGEVLLPTSRGRMLRVGVRIGG